MTSPPSLKEGKADDTKKSGPLGKLKDLRDSLATLAPKLPEELLEPMEQILDILDNEMLGSDDEGEAQLPDMMGGGMMGPSPAAQLPMMAGMG